ncbi:unnamed protein product, partial [Ixodes hexagonus]
MDIFSICDQTPTGKNTNNTYENRNENISLLRVAKLVLRLPMYYVIVVSWLIMSYLLDIFTTTLFDYAVDKGASESNALSVISYSSLADLVGRILLPLLADHNLLRRSTLTSCNFFMLGTALTCLPLVTSYGVLVGVMAAVSCFLGCGVSMCVVLLADYVGLENLEVSYALMGLSCGPLLFAKPFFVGFFRDKFGTYDDMYHIFAGLLLFLSLMWSLIVFMEKRASKRHVL